VSDIELENTVSAAATQEERERLGFKAWPASGVQTYRVQYQNTAGGMSFVDVDAATGNEAAELALKELGGGKVTNITPAPQARPTLKVKSA
jgi:hypothetical protein